MPRLLLVTPAELTRDVRARRAAEAALERGWEVVGLSGRVSGEAPVPLDGVVVVRTGRAARVDPRWFGQRASPVEGAVRRELRALLRLARLLVRAGALWRAGRTLTPVDVVHANDLDTLPAGVALARRSRARLVYDAHELYSEFESPAPRIARRLLVVLERGLARRADAIVTVSDGVADELRGRLRLRERPLVVSNAPAVAEIRPLAVSEGPVRAVYQGGLGPGRGLDDLLAAADAREVELAIRIRMADPGVLRRAVAERGLAERVRVLDPVPPSEVLDALAGFDVGVIFDRPQSRNSDLSLPNKFFEYLMAGLAIVAPHLKTIGPLVESEGIGTTYRPDDPDGLRIALERLAQDRDALGEMRRRARELAVSRLNAEAAADALARAWGDRDDAR